MADVSNSDDVIDSRDIIERIDELEVERGPLAEALQDAELQRAELEKLHPMAYGQEQIDEREAAIQSARDALESWDDDNISELNDLLALAKEAEGYGDWRHGETLIRRSHWADYVQQLAEDLGAYDSRKVSWPMTCIDWDKAASELEADYMTVDFGGTEYLMRA